MSKRCLSGVMTKNVIAVLVLLLLISLSFFTEYAFAQGDISVMLPQNSNSSGVPDGYANIPVVLQNNTDIEIGGFDLLIQYDTTAVELVGVDFSPIENCNWAIIGHRPEIPSVEKIFAAIGVSPLGCDFSNSLDTLFYLQFHILPNNSNMGKIFPLRFYWTRCADNILINTLGDSAFLSDRVFDLYTNQFIQEDDAFPTIHGAPDTCMIGGTGHKFRMVDFYNGLIDVADNGTIDETGDVNLNNIAFEIADYIVFQNYYIYGPDAFVVNLLGQTQATDCNKDGIFPTVRDLIFMYRVIIGDITPLPKAGNDDSRFFPPTALFVQDTLAKEVRLVFPDSLSAIHLIFDGEVVPAYSGPGEFGYNYDGEVTRLLISPELGGSSLPVYQGLLLTYIGDGILDSSDVSDWEMRDIGSVVQVIGGEPMCGDINASGMIDISDAIYLLNYIFYAAEPPAFMQSADVNCDSRINLIDAVSIIRYVFTGNPVPCGNCP